MNTIVNELQDTVDSLTKIATLLSAADTASGTDADTFGIHHSEKIASTSFNLSKQETIKLDSKQVLNFLKFYVS
jgi:hypothetical protein